MNTSNSDFKVVVSDEIFDFRTLEASCSRPSTIPIRTQSYNAIDVKRRRDVPTSGERHLASLDKIDKSAFHTNSLLPQRYRKPKPKIRSKTVDPRFRRCRSPTPKQINASHSTDVLQQQPRQVKNIKRMSASSPAIQTIRKETCQETEQPKTTEKEMPVSVIKPCIMSERERNFMEGSRNESTHKNTAKIEEEVLNSINYVDNKHLFETESADEVELGTYSMTRIPYWEDSRVSLHKKCQQRVIPVRNCSVLALKKLNNSMVMCRQYEGDMDNDFSPYKYDDETEICSCSLLSEKIDFRKKCFKENSYLASPVVLGSLVGLVLASFILWLIHCKFSLSMLWQTHTYKADAQKHIIVRFWNSFLYDLNILSTNVYRLLVLQRNDLFGHTESPQETSWWQNII